MLCVEEGYVWASREQGGGYLLSQRPWASFLREKRAIRRRLGLAIEKGQLWV